MVRVKRRIALTAVLMLLSAAAGAGAMRIYLDPCVAAAHDVQSITEATAALFTPAFQQKIQAVPTKLGDEFNTCRARQ
jgi:hypothetical protein